jgi:hypothetical protein
MNRSGEDPWSTGGGPGAEPFVYPAGGAGGFPDPPHPGAGDPAAAQLRSEAAAEGVLAAALSALAFLAGVWLVLAPFVLGYPDSAAARWNDIAVGAAVVVVAFVRMISPIRSVTLGWCNVGLGGWLVAAPFVLFYNDDTVATAATVNDLALGLVIIGCAALSVVAGKPSRGRPGP